MIVYLTSPKMHGVITVVYEPDMLGVMRCVGFHVQGELTEEQWRYLMANLAYEYPAEGGDVCGVLQASANVEGAELLKTQEKKEQNSKVRLYCGLYKEVFGVSYKVTGVDVSNARKDVPFEPDMIRLFLTEKRWWNKDRYTIENYVKNYNTLLLIKSGVTEDNQGFPNDYDPDYERAVSSEHIADYWAHLRSVGWGIVKNENQKVIGWQRNGIFVSKFKNK